MNALQKYPSLFEEAYKHNHTVLKTGLLQICIKQRDEDILYVLCPILCWSNMKGGFYEFWGNSGREEQTKTSRKRKGKFHKALSSTPNQIYRIYRLMFLYSSTFLQSSKCKLNTLTINQKGENEYNEVLIAQI